MQGRAEPRTPPESAKDSITDKIRPECRRKDYSGSDSVDIRKSCSCDKHECRVSRDPVRQSGNDPRNMTAAFEIFIGVLVLPRSIDPNPDDDHEIERDQSVVQQVHGVKCGHALSFVRGPEVGTAGCVASKHDVV